MSASTCAGPKRSWSRPSAKVTRSSWVHTGAPPARPGDVGRGERGGPGGDSPTAPVPAGTGVVIRSVAGPAEPGAARVRAGGPGWADPASGCVGDPPSCRVVRASNAKVWRLLCVRSAARCASATWAASAPRRWARGSTSGRIEGDGGHSTLDGTPDDGPAVGWSAVGSGSCTKGVRSMLISSSPADECLTGVRWSGRPGTGTTRSSAPSAGRGESRTGAGPGAASTGRAARAIRSTSGVRCRRTRSGHPVGRSTGIGPEGPPVRASRRTGTP